MAIATFEEQIFAKAIAADFIRIDGTLFERIEYFTTEKKIRMRSVRSNIEETQQNSTLFNMQDLVKAKFYKLEEF